MRIPTFLLLSVMVLSSVMILVPNVQAQQRAYDAPCDEGDWEKRGQCCPEGTSYIAHSMCYAEEEYEERKQKSTERLGCMLGNIGEGVLTGSQEAAAGAFDCLKE
jgi:hypothetical protein